MNFADFMNVAKPLTFVVGTIVSGLSAMRKTSRYMKRRKIDQYRRAEEKIRILINMDSYYRNYPSALIADTFRNVMMCVGLFFGGILMLFVALATLAHWSTSSFTDNIITVAIFAEAFAAIIASISIFNNLDDKLRRASHPEKYKYLDEIHLEKIRLNQRRSEIFKRRPEMEEVD